LGAISRSQAVIEFDLAGNILSANENFCKALDYRLDEIVGRHHSMFCAATVASAEYKSFWRRLSGAAFDAGTYRRVAKGGREIWIQASYNPVLRNGRPYKVVKFAADITAKSEQAVEDAGKFREVGGNLAAQAVI
jgi:methyl-accepting chemotaxis protein